MPILYRFVSVLLVATALGCISSEVDPRTTITSPPEYRDMVAQCINASEFWGPYLDTMETSSPGQPLVDFELSMDREVTGRSSGDYDPGNITVRFAATDLRSRRRFYEREATVRLDDMVFGDFSDTTTREDVQQRVFELTEKKIYPHVEIWVNIAALRAMGAQKASADVFVPILEKAADNPWGEDIPDEAKTALSRLTGRR